MENKISFEDALSRLEKIVRELENGDTLLEDSIKLFEEGIKLSEICSSCLKNAQQKVDLLIKKDGDTPVREKYNINE